MRNIDVNVFHSIVQNFDKKKDGLSQIECRIGIGRSRDSFSREAATVMFKNYSKFVNASGGKFITDAGIDAIALKDGVPIDITNLDLKA